MTICQVGAELFRANVQTDMTKVRVAFRNFAKAPKTHCVTSQSTRGTTTERNVINSAKCTAC